MPFASPEPERKEAGGVPSTRQPIGLFRTMVGDPNLMLAF